jgi:hypothetical protein
MWAGSAYDGLVNLKRRFICRFQVAALDLVARDLAADRSGSR